jgi:hypothetical protein
MCEFLTLKCVFVVFSLQIYLMDHMSQDAFNVITPLWRVKLGDYLRVTLRIQCNYSTLTS